MKFLRKRLQRLQKGFSMVELLIAIAILGIIMALATNSFDGAKTKATVMVNIAKDLGDANIQLKLDTGCYVSTAQALFDATSAADTQQNYCKRSFGNTWARAYIAKYPVDANGAIVIDKIGAGVTASFPTTPEAGGIGRRYYVHFANVPVDVIRQGLMECNSNSTANATLSQGNFNTDKCRTTANLSGEDPGDFDMVFDETR
ncbi:prepilin-type N-terminal cleavage/methylation domain-containing protein [Burkholderia cenocepacia]|uniref:prepilin-type N-terminal cleavage/methylation domain-containing protein n=1 Tax=Burkholderia cenocepacia TaxID=95486 RepID=UPI0009B453D7|nr:prepilin-type N-terminal cleavage/methylation domain-containing protein [Burkholderia cenocepacia]